MLTAAGTPALDRPVSGRRAVRPRSPPRATRALTGTLHARSWPAWLWTRCRHKCMTQHPEIPPKHKAAMKMQLSAANARLLALEKERRRLKEEIAWLTTSLKRIDGPPGVAPRASGSANQAEHAVPADVDRPRPRA